MNDGYLVKFKNYAQSEKGTGKLHYDVLAQFGKVIWGQWSTKGNPMYDKTFNRMNKEVPFYLYALDNTFALLKMKVERVLRKEEVTQEELGYLIPTYYSIDTPCANYYLISQIEIFPPEEALKVIITSSGNPAITTGQVNSRAPMKVYWDNSNKDIISPNKPIKPASYNPPVAKATSDNENNNTYAVYRYSSKIDGKTYIGMTKNLKDRISHHSNPNNWRSQKEQYKILYLMFSMYGYENYELTVLHENLTEDEAHYWEAKEIENHNCYFPNGLNKRDESKYLKNI